MENAEIVPILNNDNSNDESNDDKKMSEMISKETKHNTSGSISELIGFCDFRYFLLYFTFFGLFAVGFITPHLIQLWMDLGICMVYGVIIYISDLSNHWIIFLALAYSHAMMHYLYPFLDENGLVDGVTPFPDIMVHTVMFFYSVYILDFGDFNDMTNFNKWNISIFYKMIFLIIVCGLIINIVSSLLVYENSHHYNEAVEIFEASSIFQAISTGFFWSTSIINPLNCKSTVMIRSHIVPWLSGAIITWFIFLFDNYFMNIMVDHGFLQFIFIYPLISALTMHMFDYFILAKKLNHKRYDQIDQIHQDDDN